MTESPESPPRLPTELESLATLLGNAESKSEAWQAETGRLVAVAYVSTLSSSVTDVEYLRALALCKWAQSLKVKDALKRELSPQRFRVAEPPTLTALQPGELRRRALEVISSVKAPWCSGYIARELAHEEFDLTWASTISSWAFKNASSAVDLIDMLMKPVITKSQDSKAIEALSTQITKQFKNLTWSTARMAGQDIANSIDRLLSEAADKKHLFDNLWDPLSALIRRARALHPLVLIEVPLVVSIGVLSSALKVDAQKKRLAKFKVDESLCEATVSCLADISDQANESGMAKLKSLIPILISAYPDIRGRIESAARHSPSLASLIREEDNDPISSLEDEAGALYARLLPEWHSYVAENSSDTRLSALNKTLIEAAALNGIEYQGAADDQCEYDAIAHRIVDGRVIYQGMIRIIRPAIVYRRANGSLRVLVQAAVEAI